MASEQTSRYASEDQILVHTFSYVVGWTDASHQLHTRSGTAYFKDLSEFLNDNHDINDEEEKETRSYRFRIISLSRREWGQHRFGISEGAYQDIKRKWNLHNFTLDVFLNNNGVMSSFNTQEKQSILMKVAASRSVGFDAVSLSHIRAQNVTNVIYYALEDEFRLFNILLANPERCLQPAFFVASMYHYHQLHVEVFRKKIDDRFVAIERASKFGGPGRLFGLREIHEEQPLDSDTANITRSLSYMQTELAVAGHLARTSAKCGKWLVELCEKENNAWENSKEGKGDGDALSKALRSLSTENTRMTLDEVLYVTRRAETVVSQLQAVSDRVQSQTTFITNTASQDQSDYTATIALQTLRDSAAMKTIAVLTILFLPGTFVATLFSTNMFEWQPDDGSKPKVSKYLWVYWLISVVLTTTVMVGWFLWSKSSAERFQSLRGQTDEEDQVSEKTD